MIAKQYKLKEKEVKKVLQRGKPFFSSGTVLNRLRNKGGEHRFALVIGSKSVHNAVARNFFRRLYYDITKSYLEKGRGGACYDLVVVVKKQTKLIKNDEKSIAIFKKEIHFLLDKSFSTSTIKTIGKK